jgi:hypothetical protein
MAIIEKRLKLFQHEGREGQIVGQMKEWGINMVE